MWTPTGDRLRSPGALERAAIALLDGVGGDREWWFWNPTALIGHLRVAVTVDEHAVLPDGGPVAFDAGESGPERPRTRPRPRV